MKRAASCSVVLCVSLSFFAHSSVAAPTAKAVVYKVGVATRPFTPAEPFDWRGAKTHTLITDIWYPAEANALEMPQWIGPADSPFASAGKAAPDAPIIAAPAKFPLILLSHGTGGSSKMMAWLGTALASHGFIAAAVNHPGNNSLEDYTPQGFSLWWERASDLSVLLDQILADSTFGAHIDAKRVGAAGFSLGGFTVIEIAGGIGELSRYQEFCKSPKADRMCGDPPEFPGLSAKVAALARSDAAMQAALLDAAKSHRDPRIRAVFAMAPALGPAFSPESLAKINIPVQIVAGASDTVVPIETSAKFFASKIPGAQLTVYQAVGHYTFLATCQELGDRTRPELCVDQAGILRNEIHAQTATMAFHFFETNLK
ncbi:MAG: alpha/beta hydrolase [Candidatus Acidiferrum sp.]|jgi:predicted dienelactone hydrolase